MEIGIVDEQSILQDVVVSALASEDRRLGLPLVDN
jgi:hypothetical protein